MADVAVLRAKVLDWADEVMDLAVGNENSLMVNALREAAPVGEDRMAGGNFHPPGDTRRGIEAVPGGSPTRPGATVRSTTKQGEWVEEGTEPHIITPRNSSVLVFRGDRGAVSQPRPNSRVATRSGGVVFAKVVHHPGQPARPWFRPVVERFSEFLRMAADRTRLAA